VITGTSYVCKNCPFTTLDEEKAAEHRKKLTVTVAGHPVDHPVLKYTFRADGSVNVQ
jgi:hypothetical protein